MVEWENDKPTVVALREVAEGYVTESILEEREQPLEDLLDIESAVSGMQEDMNALRPMNLGG